MIRAVLDTNVLISGLFWSGTPAHIIDRGLQLQRDFVPIISGDILDEAEKILRGKFHLPEEDIFDFHDLVILRFDVVIPRSRIPTAVPRDPSDNKIIECAVEGRADYIVTGDLDLLDLKKYETIQIITPSKFLKLL